MSARPPDRTAPAPEPDPCEAALRLLLDQGLPAHPIADFDGVLVRLAGRVTEARRLKAERENAMLHRADALLDELIAEIPRVDEQLRQLDAIHVELRELRPHDDGGTAEAESVLAALRAHRGKLGELLESPLLQQAADRRRRRFEALRQRAQDVLTPEAEIQEREALTAAEGEAERLAASIKDGVAHLGYLGPRERSAQLRVWLGQLRKFQDNYELSPAVSREIYFAFGRINTARKQLGVDEYLDALNRNYDTNWESYVAEWEARLPAAREQDRVEQEKRDRLARERRRRETGEQERQREEAERLALIVEDLRDSHRGNGEEEADPDEIRDLLAEGVRLGGNSSEPFLEAAALFAALTWGSDLRGLRRSLRKRGVADLPENTPPAAANGAGDPFRGHREAWAGKRVAAVGGLPNEVTRARVEKGLGLREFRWYEYYRDHDTHDAVEAAIRNGGLDAVLLLVRYAGHRIGALRDVCRAEGVPCTLVDRGCGVSAILRGLGEGAD